MRFRFVSVLLGLLSLFGVVLLGPAASADDLAVDNPAAYGGYSITQTGAPITPTKAKTVPATGLSCQIGYTYYSGPMHYMYVNMSTHYQFGYTSSGDPVHRVYWNLAKTNDALGNPLDTMRSISVRVDVDGKESIYKFDSSFGYDFPVGFQSWATNSPFSAWFGDYRSLKTRQYIVGEVPPLRDASGRITDAGVVRAANRAPNVINTNYYYCPLWSVSPY